MTTQFRLLTDVQRAVVETARDFARNEIAPMPQSGIAQDTFPARRSTPWDGWGFWGC